MSVQTTADLMQWLQEKVKKMRDALIKVQALFTKWISKRFLPLCFVTPNIDPYDGSSYMKEYVVPYHYSMNPLGIPKEKC